MKRIVVFFTLLLLAFGGNKALAQDKKDWGNIYVDASFFYTYASGEFLFFLPESKSAAKWYFAAEEVHRVNGGKWQNYPWFDYSGEPAEPYAALKK